MTKNLPSLPESSVGQRSLASRSKALHQSFVDSLKPSTRRSYAESLEVFSVFLGATSPIEMTSQLLSLSAGEANGLVLSFQQSLQKRGLSTSTINTRIAAVRSLVRLGKLLGLVMWTIGVPSLKVEAYRDTKGAPEETYETICSQLLEHSRKGDSLATRNLAILRLLHDLALRRNEILTLDLEHLDLKENTLLVLRKGHSQRIRLTVPTQTIEILKGWLTARGSGAGPLFYRLDIGAQRTALGRLSGSALYKLVKSYDLMRPHAMRHLGITKALNVTNGDVRAVQQFSGHKDVRVLLKYDDNRKDLAGQVAKLVAAPPSGQKTEPPPPGGDR